MASIYTHIDQNKRDTVVIIAAFITVITALAYAFSLAYDISAGFMVGVALIISGFSSLISYYNSDKIVLAITGAKEATPQEYPQLHSLVENMSIASGLPKPRIYIIHDSAMNAFATGRNPQKGVIVFTTGILQRLEKRELEGVIAHEMAHIGNYDIRLMSIVSILVGSVTLMADWFTRGALYGGRGKKENNVSGIVLVLALIFIILSPIIATLIKLAMSRNREYLADSTAALITRYPQGLANALRKLSQDKEILEAANGATAHMYIVHPLYGQKSKFMGNLFNTHPPIQERITRLETM